MLGSLAHPQSPAVLSQPHVRRPAAGAGVPLELCRHVGGGDCMLDPVQHFGSSALAAVDKQKPQLSLAIAQPAHALEKTPWAQHCPMNVGAGLPVEVHLCLPSIACLSC